MLLNPQEYRSKLLELIHASTTVTHYFESKILHAPEYFAAPGWSRLSRSADFTAEHARRILAADDLERARLTLDHELTPPLPPIADRLGEHIAQRRAREASESRRVSVPRPRP